LGTIGPVGGALTSPSRWWTGAPGGGFGGPPTGSGVACLVRPPQQWKGKRAGLQGWAAIKFHATRSGRASENGGAHEESNFWGTGAAREFEAGRTIFAQQEPGRCPQCGTKPPGPRFFFGLAGTSTRGRRPLGLGPSGGRARLYQRRPGLGEPGRGPLPVAQEPEGSWSLGSFFFFTLFVPCKRTRCSPRPAP